jgi:hypothetical protein
MVNTPAQAGTWLFANYGKPAYPRIVAPGINGYAIFGTVIIVPGRPGSPGIIKYPADFVFPPFRDEGGIPTVNKLRTKLSPWGAKDCSGNQPLRGWQQQFSVSKRYLSKYGNPPN